MTYTPEYDFKLHHLTENDEEYHSILQDFRQAEADYLALYRSLDTEQQAVLTEFIGRLSELHLRQLTLLETHL